MSHLAFLPYPSYGHMMPALPVVAELASRGHRVTCFVTEPFEERARAAGAEPHRYEPPLSADPPGVGDGDECAWAALRLLEASTAVMPSIEKVFADDTPDAVVYDTTLWLTGRLLSARWRRPRVQLSATFVSNDHFNLAEATQEFSGPVDPNHPALAMFAERMREAVTGSGLDEARQAELFHGRDEYTVAFVPRALQIAGETFDDRHVFVGPTNTESGHWQPPESGAPVLLMTLGTTVNDRPDFFRECAAAFAELPWHTVMALGNRVSVEELGPLPPNVEAFSWVPLGAVLKHATVSLNQAGMGSVLGAFENGVPMVVVPHHSEQQLNARRLAELGLARVVPREEATPEALREAVVQVAGDETMRARVAEMREHVRAAGGARRAADAIEEHVLRSAEVEAS